MIDRLQRIFGAVTLGEALLIFVALLVPPKYYFYFEQDPCINPSLVSPAWCPDFIFDYKGMVVGMLLVILINCLSILAILWLWRRIGKSLKKV